MTRSRRLFLLVALSLPAIAAANQWSSNEAGRMPPAALLIVAHPDDEYEMAGTVYRIAKELRGNVDELIVTDGEAGYHYSSLAAAYYGVDLTNEAVGRARLPEIRREEAQAAAKVLGIRHQWFLDEKDDHYTLDPEEVIRHSWDADRVSQAVEQRLQEGGYDFIFLLLPRADTHGEHKAASILALKAVFRLPEPQRPIVFGALAGGDNVAAYAALPPYPLTATTSSLPAFRFDRDTRFGYRDSLSYQIVVDWVIAEHKSQGLLQTRCRRDRFENFWLFTLNRASAADVARSLFGAITSQPHAQKIGLVGPAKSSSGNYFPAATERGFE